MKKFYLPLFIGMACIYYSCIPSPSKMIIGEWKLKNCKVVDVDSIVKILIAGKKNDADERLKEVDSLILISKGKKKDQLVNDKISIIKYQEHLLIIRINRENSMMNNKVKFEFNSDNSYNYNDSSYSVFEKGKWRISDDNRILILKPESEAGKSFIIHEIRGDKLFIESDRKIEEFTIPFYLYFYR